MTKHRRQFTMAQALLLIMLGALLCSFFAAVFRHIRTFEFYYPAVISPDLRLLAASYKTDFRLLGSTWEGDESAFLVDLETRERLMPGVGPIAFSHDSARVAMHDWDRNVVRIWDLKPLRELPPLEGDFESTFGFDESGDVLVILGEDTIQRWDVNNGRSVGSVPIKPVEYADVEEFSPDGKLLARCWYVAENQNSIVEIWDTKTGELFRTIINPNDDEIEHALFTPDGSAIVLDTSYETTRVWDLRTGKQRLAIEGFNSTLALSPDGEQLAFTRAAVDRMDALSINLCDLEGHEFRQLGVLNAPWIGTMQFSRDGKILATADKWGRITFWSVETGEIIRKIRGLKPWRPWVHWYMLAGVAVVWAVLWWLTKPKGSSQPPSQQPARKQKRDLGWHLVLAVVVVGLFVGCTHLYVLPYESQWLYQYHPPLFVPLLPLGFIVGLLISLVWFRYNLLNFLFGLLILVAMFLYAAFVAGV